MKRLVSMVIPFTRAQTVYVYDDNEQIETLHCNMEDLDKLIVTIAAEYDATQVNLVGPRAFLKGLENKIHKSEILEYGMQKLDIQYLKDN